MFVLIFLLFSYDKHTYFNSKKSYIFHCELSVSRSCHVSIINTYYKKENDNEFSFSFFVFLKDVQTTFYTPQLIHIWDKSSKDKSLPTMTTSSFKLNILEFKKRLILNFFLFSCHVVDFFFFFPTPVVWLSYFCLYIFYKFFYATLLLQRWALLIAFFLQF